MRSGRHEKAASRSLSGVIAPTASTSMGSPNSCSGENDQLAQSLSLSPPVAKIKLATVPQELVVRSLRRRFWSALQHDDSEQALLLYQATRTDWERILQNETAESASLDETDPSYTRKINKLIDIPVLKKPRSGWVRRRGQSNDSNNNSNATKEEEEDALIAILPRALKPNDFFLEDDMQHPILDPYMQLPANRIIRSPVVARNNRIWFLSSASTAPINEGLETPLHEPPREDSSRTTPLHEAARIGNGDLVRCLISLAGGGEECDMDVKNGLGQTPLHAAAGGLTRKEAKRVKDENKVSILSPRQRDDDEPTIATKHGIWLRPSRYRRNLSNKSTLRQLVRDNNVESSNQWNDLKRCRLDAALALLTAEASTNVVDQHGRTPLHYAAALGRTEMAVAFLNTFGTLLTVVDGFGRTPAECAALQGHSILAAQLEARALLTMDPLDLDLLESIQQQNAEQNGDHAHGPGVLSPPFAWFTTFDMNRVQQERQFRVKVTLERMQQILERLNGGQSARDILFKSLSSISNNSRTSMGERSPASASPPSSNSGPSSPPPRVDLDSLNVIHEGQVAEFLSHHDWDVKRSLAAFYEDPVGSFAESKIALPPATSNAKQYAGGQEEQATCLICCEEFETGSDAWRFLECSHGFCVSCLGEFISDGAKSRELGFAIPCPHHECSVLMTPTVVSDLIPTPGIKAMLTETANNNFVLKAWDFRFCPHAGCNHVVKFLPPKTRSSGKTPSTWITSCAVCCTPESHTKRKENSPFITYEGIFDESYFDCQSGIHIPRAHRFCFKCGEGAHWPVTCQCLEQWQATVEEQIKDVEVEEGTDYNDVSQKLWIKANTRPCPKCKAPIEKNDGCNHVTCSNPYCKHEFCWVCRNDWSLHGTNTGGFFRCNRWVDDGEDHQFYDKTPTADELRIPTDEDLSDPRRMRAIYGTAMHERRVASKRSREMARFLHHYQRFSAHADSAKLEAKMADSCAQRLQPIVQAAIEFSGDPAFNFWGKGLSFVFDAFTELRECRSVLQHSYAFSFFRYGHDNKGSRRLRRRVAEAMAFEQLQADLEMITEQMSDLVARAHMRATQSQILFMTLTAAQKRRDFSGSLLRIQEKGKDDPELSEDGSERSLGSEGDIADRAASLSLFRPVHAMPTDTGSGDNLGNERQQRDGYFGDAQFTISAADAAFQASLQSFRESIGSLNMLLNTSYDSNDILLDDDDEAGEHLQWSCTACTFINNRGTRCSMCGTFSSPSLHRIVD